tara:strand:+ start:594 stop:983 length:390 start_codon:yes stop_codon:yes gene_type:complete
MKIEVSNGEIIDKLSILSIKLERVTDAAKLSSIQREYNELLTATTEIVHIDPQIEDDYQELREINQKIWDVEEAVRAKEDSSDFGAEFVKCARQIYALNDERFVVKFRINTKTQSPLEEHKSHRNCYAQ